MIFTFLSPASTCCQKRYPEPARLSRASQSSGKAFTLDCLRARGTIFTQVETSENITTPFLPGRQLPDFLRRFPIRYSCLGTVCLFVWSVGADKPSTYSLYRGSTSCTAYPFWKSRFGHSGCCHPLNLSSVLYLGMSLHYPNGIWLSAQQCPAKTQCQLPCHRHDRFLLAPTIP